jgi:hydrogenase expression/formation protein HypE
MQYDKILLDHGSGGKLAHQLTLDLLLPLFGNPLLTPLHDGAMFEFNGQRLAFSTDTYTVDPIFFPGGDIGELAVNGTVNDVAMCGAEPQYLSLALMIEEGFPIDDLKRILASAARAAQTAGVEIVTGDTKVVPKGAVDQIFINTSGIGMIPDPVNIGPHRARPGDQVLMSGTLADHGITVMIQREQLGFDADVQSDTAPLNHMVREMVATGADIHVLRDPTRGGVGTALNEIAGSSTTGIRIYEDRIPVKPAVGGVCELLGFDPLYLANEGKLLAFVSPEDTEPVLEAMRGDPSGTDACIIGEVTADHPGKVVMETRIGGTRFVDMLTGEQLPRIC